MGEVKRWYPSENCGSADMAEFRDDGKYVTSDEREFVELRDYARLEREHAAAQAELTRLRAVEAAAEQWCPAVSDMPEQLMAAKRVHVSRCDAFADWFVGWGKSEDCHIEGTANHWFWLAYLILGLVKESDRPYNEDKPLPFSPQYIRDRLGLAEACGRKG